MSLLKNIDIWKGNIPRVCNFDLLDYCDLGVIGNNTTGLSGVQTNSSSYADGLYLNARATRDAYQKALDEMVLALMGSYVDQEDYDGNPFPTCITEEEWNNIWAFLNGPDGPYYKFRDFSIQQALFFNSLMPSNLKRTDTVTTMFKINIRPYEGPNSIVDIPFTIDYSTALYPTLQTYKNYTKSLRDYVQSFKRVFQALNNDTFPIFQP